MDTTTTPTITLDHPGLNDAERQAALALMRALDAYRAERGCPPSAVVTLHAKDVAVSQTIAERLESMLFERMAIPLAHVPAALFDTVGRARDRHRKALTAFTLCLQPPTLDPAEPHEFTSDPAPAPGNANLRMGETRETAQPVTTSAIHRHPRPATTPIPRSLGKEGWPSQRDSANRSGSAPTSPPGSPVDRPSHRFPMNVPESAPAPFAKPRGKGGAG
jgi:hypothetical protein